MAKVIHYDRTGIRRRVKKLEKREFLTSKLKGKSKILFLTEQGS